MLRESNLNPVPDPLADLEYLSRVRASPPPDLADRMEQVFPTEREFERMLRRKVRRRAQPAGQDHTSLDRLGACLDGLLRSQVDGPFSVSNLRWLAGGASKIQMAFDLDWVDPAIGRRTISRLVLRMEPPEALNTTSRLREFQILQAFAGVLPVPRVYWVDEDARWFPEPALIYAFCPGVTKPSAVPGRVTGIGNAFEPHLRAALAEQFVDHLAIIHTFDPTAADLSAFDRPETGATQSALWQLNRARRVWEEDRGEELPLLEVAAQWLSRNLPETERISVLHGDYRTGNFLFDESSGRISAWLDWERGYLGDRHRDLAWIMQPQIGNYAEDGSTFLVSGLLPRADFCAAYEERSGLTIDGDRLRFYQILNSYQIIVSLLGTAYRVVRLGRSHQDVLLAWMEGIVYSFMEELRVALSEGGL